jgi:two-component system NtrC family sensor kinase
MLLNAGHAMTAGGTLTIISARATDINGVVVKIADTGCGIPEENLFRIFDPFFTTKDTSGTGLGLSVSYGIIDSHGGSIEVESSVGIGTTFTITLPINPDMAQKDRESGLHGSGTFW